MTTTYDVEVTGTFGTPVLLLPGGAATSRGFFPGLRAALGDQRIIALDRPGTGLAVNKGVATLATGSAAAAEAIRDVGAGPAVVLAQSLGGPVALQLAVDHPDLVAGLVLIDPTPFNDARTCVTVRRLFAGLTLPTRLPVVGPRVDAMIWRALAAKQPVADDEARAAMQVMITSASLQDTAKAIRVLAAEGAALTPRLRRLDVPVVLITAQRKPGDRIRAAHDAVAAAVGGTVEAWPGAVHAEHLRDPARVNELVRSVLDQVPQVSR